MTHTRLKEFFKEKTRKTTPQNVDWNAKRDAWIASINALYDEIQKYLKDTDVTLKRQEKPIWENFIGDYRVPELLLRAGDEQVLFSPKGVNVVGAQGRVDVFGDRGVATLVRQHANRWCVVASRTPTLRLMPLTADSFGDMLSGIMRP